MSYGKSGTFRKTIGTGSWTRCRNPCTFKQGEKEKEMAKRSIVLMLAVLVALGCTVTAGAQAKTRYADQLYVEVSALNSLEYFYDHKEGMRLVGEDLGVKTEYTGPADYDMNAVAAAIDNAIAKKAAGIVLVGWEESLNGAIKKATDAGIPVVTCDADLPSSTRVAFVGTSNYTAGQELAKWWVKKLNGKGKIALLGMPTLSNIRDRIDGMKNVFAASQIQIVTIGDSKTDSIGAAGTATAILQKYPDLSGMIGVDSHSGAGIGTAVREAGKAGKVIVTGWDRTTPCSSSSTRASCKAPLCSARPSCHTTR